MKVYTPPTIIILEYIYEIHTIVYNNVVLYLPFIPLALTYRPSLTYYRRSLCFEYEMLKFYQGTIIDNNS